MRKNKSNLFLLFLLHICCIYLYPQGLKFNQYFLEKNKISLNTKDLEIGIGYLKDLKVVNNKIIFIDSKGKQVLLFNEKGHFIKFLGREGQGPGEFFSPEAGAVDDKGNIYIADYYTRRINIYDPRGNFKTSFITQGIHWTPHVIRINRNGHMLLGGYKTNFEKPNTGTWINVYNEKGKYIKSFFSTNPRARETEIRPFSKCWFDLDKNDNVYAIQETYYKIYKFDSKFNLLKKFGEVPDYYVPPKLPPNEKGVKSIEELKKIRLKYFASWTQLVNLTVVKSFVLIFLKTNNINGISTDYIIDVYDKQGNLVIGGIQTDFKFLCKDKNANLYFLIYTNEEEALEKNPEYKIGIYQLRLK